MITTDGVLVADGQGRPDATRKMVDHIKTLTNQPITCVIVCSEHRDHTGGNVSFPSTATFVASPFSTANLQQQARSANRGTNKPQTIVPTETVSDRQGLRMGNTEIEIVYNGRAHTGGDLQVHLPKERIFFLSEAFSNHIFPSMRTATPSEWKQTLKKVQQVDADIVVPGHGFVDDPSTLREGLAAFAKAVEYVVAEVTRVHKTGATVEEALKPANWGPYAASSVIDRNAPNAVRRIYDELDGKLK